MDLFFVYPFILENILKNFSRFNIIFLSFLFIYSPNSDSQSLSAAQIYKKVSNAVVVIHAYNDNGELATQGSGVVLNDKGYVVTNYHVLSGNKRIEILHGNKIIPYVDIIGIDVEKDILILKIEANKFPAVKIGSSESLIIGQRVYAIGSPMGLENSISEGIISGLRSYDEIRRNFIQISASISPGSSGGAIVNDRGELIGISTLTLKEGQNLNFAIPIDDILKVEIGSFSRNERYKDFELFDKGYRTFEKGDYQEAIKYFSRYIEKYPNDRDALCNRGISKKKLKDYQGSIKDYNKAIELNPNDAMVYVSRGNAKNDFKDYVGAIKDYNKAIELNPNVAMAYFNRGLAKSNLMDYQGEIQDYNKAIEINPNFAEAYYSLGTSRSDLKDYVGAIKDFNKAIALNPNYEDAYINRGAAKCKLEDFRGAIQDYRTAIKLNPKDSRVYNNSGAAKSKLEDYRGAISDYNKAIELNPYFAEAYVNRGIAKGHSGDHQDAIIDFNKATILNPNLLEAYVNRGIAEYSIGNKHAACLDWGKAGKLGSAKALDFIKKCCK